MALGGVCGTLTGALATVGLRLGGARDEEPEAQLMWDYVSTLVNGFRRPGSEAIYCCDLVGVDWRDPEVARTYWSEKVLCLRLVGERTMMLAEMLDRTERDMGTARQV